MTLSFLGGSSVKYSRIKRVLFTVFAGIVLAMIAGVCYYQPFFPNGQGDEDCIWCIKSDGTPYAATTWEEFARTPSLNNSSRFDFVCPTIHAPIYRDEHHQYFMRSDSDSGLWNVIKKENSSDVSCGQAPFDPPVKNPYHPVWSDLSHHILFMYNDRHRDQGHFEPKNSFDTYQEGIARTQPYCQQTIPEKYRDETSLIFLENFSESAYTWKQFPFEHYMSGDANLLCWAYSEKHHGFFMLWEVHPANRNELLYYDLNTHRVCKVKPISIVADGYFHMELIQGENHLFIFSTNYVEIYSIPDFTLVKRVLLAHRTHPDTLMSISSDLKYAAFGSWELFLMDMDSRHSWVLDPLYSQRLSMDFLYFSLDSWGKYALIFPYKLNQIQFVNDTHILSAINGRGEYYQWDADTHDRIEHSDATEK